jgi:ABC-2 type transport system permease protein
MTTQTKSQSPLELRLAAREGLLPVADSRWFAGFNNMLDKELGEWFHTRRWILQLLLWPAILNGFVALFLIILPLFASSSPNITPALEKSFGGLTADIEGITLFYSVLAMAGVLGVITIAQDVIIQEKQTGTAAWILSKPADRAAFILSKMVANAIGILVFIIVVPGLILLVEILLVAKLVLPIVPFLTGLGIFLLALIFYLSLVTLLGVLFESRKPVMGISYGVLLGGTIFIQIVPKATFFLPFGLDKLASLVTLEKPIPEMAFVGVIVTAVLSAMFILVALLRFQKLEL